jgi:TPR repeat protein
LDSSSKQNNTNAQYNLALMYYSGDGADLNVSKSAELLESAANGGHAIAQQNVGRVHMQLLNFDKAAAWFEKSAAAGDESSYYALAEIYAQVEKFKEAKVWAQKAIKSGNKEAELLYKKYALEKY